jgi:Family of unknown function (DUF5683)
MLSLSLMVTSWAPSPKGNTIAIRPPGSLFVSVLRMRVGTLVRSLLAALATRSLAHPPAHVYLASYTSTTLSAAPQPPYGLGAHITIAKPPVFARLLTFLFLFFALSISSEARCFFTLDTAPRDWNVAPKGQCLGVGLPQWQASAARLPLGQTYTKIPRRLVSMQGEDQAPKCLFSSKDTTALDSTKKVKTGFSPKKIVLMSLVLPGSGQFINKKYWKLPIVAGGFYLGYRAIDFNIGEHNYYKNVLVQRAKYNNNLLPGIDDALVRQVRDAYNRQLQVSVLATGLFYILVAVDAFVDAHLSTFDVSDDLSFEPYVPSQDLLGLGQAQGITLRYHF